jgi:glycosyltransferase involved in cell wall biosynthesis
MSDKSKKLFNLMSQRSGYNPWFSGFELIGKNWDEQDDLNVELSIIIPVFNKAKIIEKQLRCLLSCLTKKAEIILIDDGSIDNSSTLALNLLSTFDYPFTILRTEFPIYETACDCVGLEISSGHYICELQSDIFLNDIGFDRKLIDSLEVNEFCSVSGRCGHSWSYMFSFRQKLTAFLFGNLKFKDIASRGYSVGRVGMKVFDNTVILDSASYIVETNNRGPWLTSKKVISVIGFLNDKEFFLGNDDHDFNWRGFQKGYKAGYVNVNFNSYFEDGSTRQKREGVNFEIYNWLQQNKKGSIKLYKSICMYRFNEFFKILRQFKFKKLLDF